MGLGTRTSSFPRGSGFELMLCRIPHEDGKHDLEVGVVPIVSPQIAKFFVNRRHHSFVLPVKRLALGATAQRAQFKAANHPAGG